MDCTDRAFRKRLGRKQAAASASLSYQTHIVFFGHCASCRFRFHVTRKVAEDGLPPALLLLDGMRRLAIEGDADVDTVRAGRELDLGIAIACSMGAATVVSTSNLMADHFLVAA
jgi:hypothetical protein